MTHMECQGFCKGPVARVTRDEQTVWFNKLRGKELPRDLVKFLTHGTLSPALKKRRKEKVRA